MTASSHPDPGQPAVRIGNAEREAAARALGDHFAAGRLDQAEFDERVGAVYAARTHAELAVLFTDLPEPRPVPAPGGRVPVAGSWRGGSAPPGTGQRWGEWVGAGWRVVHRSRLPWPLIIVPSIMALLGVVATVAVVAGLVVSVAPLLLLPLVMIWLVGRGPHRGWYGGTRCGRGPRRPYQRPGQ
ncbi:MAG: DUF1707 domain-containing protein [Actinobacteria bacterium]|nr:DUF1707 domain-containing protein [Actinomycetota bacterium]